MGIEKRRPRKQPDESREEREEPGMTRRSFLFGGVAVGALAATGLSNKSAGAKQSDAGAEDIEEPQEGTLTELEVDYLAQNVYHEGRGESTAGQLAIAQVTLNRLACGRYGKDLAAVIFKPYQFSWTTDPKILLTEMNKDTYENIRAVLSLYVGKPLSEAVQSLSEASGIPASAEFYKRTDWDENDPKETRMSDRTKEMFRSLVKVGTIGEHTFYAHPDAKLKKAQK